MEIKDKINELLKDDLEKIYNLLVSKFPEMIEKKQAIWIEPVYNKFPEVIKKIQENWEVEFIYDKETESEVHFLKPLNKKTGKEINR